MSWMKQSEFKLIADQLKEIEDVHKLACLPNHPTYNTLLSIYAAKYQKHVRKTAHIHKQHKREYLTDYLHGVTLFDLAVKVNYAPSLLARLVYEEYLLRVKNISVSPNELKQLVSKGIRDPSSIDDERLREQVVECHEQDDIYSPTVERTKHNIGLEYEYILQEKLTNLNIPFKTEDLLRSLGYPLTPDALLEVPIAVQGRIVHWIDSKATFGDEYSHKQNLEQMLRYFNRYGPGMVIYWFDFVEELNMQDEFILVNAFPRTADIVRLYTPPKPLHLMTAQTTIIVNSALVRHDSSNPLEDASEALI
eukprot:TRINITY_DN6349_c0_g1_i1.p1 TRINITY_DN6349_c0_g1~~TRINITY_DN6349_c0_g1_i1.p1  ORF type:complete len:307 (-),score=65.23 TRINITY_DN6349_c0_g1_i1:92-1012(-)